MTEYSETDLLAITQRARYLFLGEEVAKQVMTDEEMAMATMVLLKFPNLGIRFDNFEPNKFEWFLDDDLSDKFRLYGRVDKYCSIPPIYEYISELREGLVKVSKKDKSYFIDAEGKIKLDVSNYSIVGNCFSEGLVAVGVWSMGDIKLDYLSINGELLNGGFPYCRALPFVNGMAIIKYDSKGKSHFLKKDGTLLKNKQFHTEYDEVGNFEGNFAKVTLGGKKGFIDKEGNFYATNDNEYMKNIALLMKEEIKNDRIHRN